MKRKTVVILVVVVSCVIFFGFMVMVMMASLGLQLETGFSGFGPKVAVIELYGPIYDASDFVRQVKKYTDDNSVKALVIDINSPGGGVAASQEMHARLIKAREAGKVVVASMGSVAASGGYYVACAADRVVANPGTVTGSIGVILSFPTGEKLLDKIGLGWETVKSGDLKDVGAFERSMTPEEERMLQAVIDDTYEQFVEAVAEGRNKAKDDIYPLADGSIFTGRQAYNLGLIDTLGTLDEAIAMAGEMCGLGSDPDRIKERKRQPSILDLLSETLELLNSKVSSLESNQSGLMYLYR